MDQSMEEGGRCSVGEASLKQENEVAMMNWYRIERTSD